MPCIPEKLLSHHGVFFVSCPLANSFVYGERWVTMAVTKELPNAKCYSLGIAYDRTWVMDAD